MKKAIEYSIHERIDPREDHVMFLSRLAHLKRYAWATQFIKKSDTVLDAGCGYGYGAAELMNHAQTVIAVDRSTQAIAYAQQHYPGPQYRTCDLEKFIIREVDAIVCFEAIEHFDDPKTVLKQLRSALPYGGYLLLSTPNAKTTAKNNKHHTQEFTRRELEQIINDTGFSIERFCGQYPILGTAAELARKCTRYSSNTDKRSGLIPRIIDNVPYLPQIFSGIYDNNIMVNTARTFCVAAKKC